MLGSVIRLFFRYSWTLRSVYLAQVVLVLVGAVSIAMVEGIPIGDAVYFAFISALTIGYGDIVPKTPIGRTVSILLGVVGLLLTGLIIAVAVKAVRDALDETRKRE